jgi:hypothetical protein
VIVRAPASAQAASMTWEEDTQVERLLHLFRPHGTENTPAENDARRNRSDRMRYFLTVYGAAHWADRVGGGGIQLARRGNVAL